MERMFTWGGKSIGYRDGENLWTYSGKHVGKFHGDEVYGPEGHYLGELKNGKLIAKTSMKARRKSRFTPRMNRMGRVKTVNHVGRVMLVGYEDFPDVEGC